MMASQIVGKKIAKWLVTHGLLINSDQYFDSRRSLLAYAKAVYLKRNIVNMDEDEIVEVIKSDLELFEEIVARRILRGDDI